MPLAVGGLATALYPHFHERLDEGETHPAPYIGMLLASAALCGVANVVGQIAKDSAPLSVRVMGEMGFATLFLIPVTVVASFYHKELFADQEHNYVDGIAFVRHAPLITWLYLFLLALGPTTLCFALYYYCMDNIGTGSIASAFIIPVIALVLGIQVNGEWEGVSTESKIFEVVGIALVFAGTFLVLYRDVFPPNVLHTLNSGGMMDQLVDANDSYYDYEDDAYYEP
jgi:drug/metabolite transporter (DMT)-like permease